MFSSVARSDKMWSRSTEKLETETCGSRIEKKRQQREEMENAAKAARAAEKQPVTHLQPVMHPFTGITMMLNAEKRFQMLKEYSEMSPQQFAPSGGNSQMVGIGVSIPLGFPPHAFSPAPGAGTMGYGATMGSGAGAMPIGHRTGTGTTPMTPPYGYGTPGCPGQKS